MKRWICTFLLLAMLAPSVAFAADGHDPKPKTAYVVLVPEEVASTGALLEDYYAYPVPMGAEANTLASPSAPASSMPVVGLPPLVWGLVLSLPGVIVVRLNSQERSATQKAMLGAGINLAVLTVLYFTVISPVTKGK